MNKKVEFDKEQKFLRNSYELIYGTTKIFERLIKCSYPFNCNDYIFVKPPFQEKEIPCDHKIASLMNYLWDKNIITEGSNQPDDNNYGFITFKELTSDKKLALSLIKDILGEKFLNFYNKKILKLDIRSEQYSKNLNEKRCKILDKDPEIFQIEISDLEDPIHVILFREKALENIYKILGLNFENRDNIILGYLSCKARNIKS